MHWICSNRLRNISYAADNCECIRIKITRPQVKSRKSPHVDYSDKEQMTVGTWTDG